jgi:hypothetical protein
MGCPAAVPVFDAVGVYFIAMAGAMPPEVALVNCRADLLFSPAGPLQGLAPCGRVT